MDNENVIDDQMEEPEESLPELEGSVGLGVDLVEIERIKRILGRTRSFRTRVYTEGERAYCESMAQPHVHYATRFAAKEAVLKALGTGFAFGIGPADVEVVRNQYGRPSVQLHRKAAEVAAKQGVREIPVSLSYTHSEAVACAMAITADSVRVAKERVNPMEELAKQFKEARTLLDDLPVQHEDGRVEGSLPSIPTSADESDMLEGNDGSDEVDVPVVSEAPDALEIPEAPEAQRTPGTLETPETPEALEMLDVQETQDASETSDAMTESIQPDQAFSEAELFDTEDMAGNTAGDEV